MFDQVSSQLSGHFTAILRHSMSPCLGLTLGLVFLTAGCHVGNFSATLDEDSSLPQFEFSAIPSQSEPDIEVDSGETQASTGHFSGSGTP
tara:strand:- start:610 stop:879 length:270 start_codon:yes stop_codon:yes gene_type:complete